MGGIETFIVLPVAAFHLAIMPWRIGADKLMLIPCSLRRCWKRVGLKEPPWELERLVNSCPLSVWTHSMGQGKAFTRCSRN